MPRPFDQHVFAALDTAAAPMWVFNVENHQIFWANSQGLRFWEAETVQELAARDFSSDSASVRARLRALTSSGATTDQICELWTLYPKDQPRSVLVSIQSIRIPDDRPAILVEVIRPVAEHTDAASLRITAATWATASLISTFDLSGNMLAQNPAAALCYGMPPREADPAWSDLARRLGCQDIASQLLARVADDEAFAWEIQVQTVNGPRTHHISSSKSRDPVTGEVIAVVNEEDVSDLAAMRAQQERTNNSLARAVEERTEQLLLSQKRYELALATASVWDWDLLADKLYASETLARELGYERAEFEDIITRLRLAALVHPDDVAAYESELARHLQTPTRPFLHEFRMLTRTGAVIWYRGQGKCILDATGKPVRFIGLLTNVSDRKHLETRLVAAQRMEAVGQLTGGIAHDFNNLLTVIQGNAELLQETSDIDRHLVSDIIGAVRRGANLVSHLLSFSRKQALAPQTVNLQDLLAQMRATLLRALREDIDVTIIGAHETWPVHLDVTQMESAILNIALNARDAMPKGGDLIIECRNRQIATVPDPTNRELPKGRYVDVRITDTGEGMTPETLARAVEPFFTTKDVGHGSGLGLSMVMGFARQSGGDCLIESTPEKGTTITLTLPVGDPVQARVEATLRPSR